MSTFVWGDSGDVPAETGAAGAVAADAGALPG